MGRRATLCTASLLCLIITGAASAKKPPIELDPGFFTWDKLSYADTIGPGKLSEKDLLDYREAVYDAYDEVLTYDGDSTLVRHVDFRLKLSDEARLSRWTVAVIDPTAGESIDDLRGVLRRAGKPDHTFGLDDLKEEAFSAFGGYYSSQRAYYVELPEDLGAGSLEMDVTVTTHSPPGFEGFVMAMIPLQVDGYVRSRTLTLRYPKEAPLTIVERGFTSRFKPRKDGDLLAVRYELEQLRHMVSESNAAHPYANYPLVLASSLPEWSGFNDRFSAGWEERLVADEAIAAKVAELTEGLDDERARAEAVYRYVTGETHYLGVYVEGDSRWLPHAAAEVLSRGYGDCKDKSALLISMLREAGIQAWPAQIQAGRMGFVDEQIPAWLSNHAIAYAVIDGEGVFLDGTSSPYLFGTPSERIRHRTALVHRTDAVEFVETPAGDPMMDGHAESVTLRLVADGTLTAEVDLVYEGANAAALRQRFRDRTNEDIDRMDREWITRHYLMPEELEVTQDEEDPAAGSGPLTRHVSLRSDEHVRHIGQVLMFHVPLLEVPPGMEPGNDTHNFAAFVEPFRYTARVEIAVPPGYQAVDLPDPVKVIRPGGRMEIKIAEATDTISIAADATWTAARLAPAAAETYAQFRKVLADALDIQLVLMEVGR